MASPSSSPASAGSSISTIWTCSECSYLNPVSPSNSRYCALCHAPSPFPFSSSNPKKALVIGVAEYDNRPLINPTHDACRERAGSVGTDAPIRSNTKNNCEHFRNMFGADRDTDGTFGARCGVSFFGCIPWSLVTPVENVLVRLEPMLRSEILVTDIEVSYEYPLIFVEHALLVLDRTPS